MGPRFTRPGLEYLAGGRSAQVPGDAGRHCYRTDLKQPRGMAVASDVRACGVGQFVYRQTAAVQPITLGPGHDLAPAAQCRGGGHAGTGDQPVDCPLAVGSFATVARRESGSSRAGFIQYRRRIFLRLSVGRFLYPLRPQLRGRCLLAVGRGVFRVMGGAVCVIWCGIDRAYSNSEHGGEHPADLLGLGGSSWLFARCFASAVQSLW